MGNGSGNDPKMGRVPEMAHKNIVIIIIYSKPKIESTTQYPPIVVGFEYTIFCKVIDDFCFKSKIGIIE